MTHHSALDHWKSPLPVNTGNYSIPDQGPCWIHPLKLQNLQIGEYWMGLEITFVTRSTYATLPYQFLPAKALLNLNPQRELVKIDYMIPYNLTGTAYFDAETGLLLQYSRLTGFVLVFFILSEINYDFAKQVAFAEDLQFYDQNVMKLPEDSVVSSEKITDYLLKWQPDNDKSKFLNRAGRSLDN